GEADIERAGDGLDVDRLERDPGGIETLMHPPGMDQLAGQVVGPLMIGAGEAGALAALLLADLEAAMPAGIEEGAQRAGAVAQDDDRAASDRQGEELSWPLDLALEAGEEPPSVEDRIEIDIVEGGIAVKPPGQRILAFAGLQQVQHLGAR